MENFTINNSEFELFTSFGGKFSPKITISKPGGLSFSNGAYNKYGLEKYSHVQLLYSRQQNAIAIKLLSSNGDNAIMLKHRTDNKGGFVHAKSFIDAYSLEKYYGKRLTPQKVEHLDLGEVLIINLNEENS